MINVPVLSGNAGELSPLIDARSDLKKYSSGARTELNFIPRIYGCLERRPGTKFINSTKNRLQKARLVPFQFSDTIAYQMEVGPDYIRFYYDGELLVGTTTTPDDWVDGTTYKMGEFVTSDSTVYRCIVAHTADDNEEDLSYWVEAHTDDDDYPICETPTPYQVDDLFELQFHQSADVVWITHNNYAPRKLTRTTIRTFDLAVINFTDGPFQKRNDLANDDDITLTPSGTLKSFTNYASSDNDGVAAESGASGTASGAVANTNDGDTATYRKRRGNNNEHEFLNYNSSWSYFTTTITFDVTAVRLDEIKYWIGWYNNGTATRTVAVSVKIGGAWTEVGTSTHNKVSIYGPWENVTAVKIYLYNKSTWVSGNAYADCLLYELEAWGTNNPDLTYKEITLTASSAVFDSSQVGSDLAPGALFRLTQPRAIFKTSGSLGAEGVISAPIDVKGEFHWNSHGQWTGTIELQRNENNEGWETFRTFLSHNDRNIMSQAYTEESDNVQYRVEVTDWGEGTIRSDITVDESTQSGVCRIVGYTSPTIVTAEIITDFASTDATLRWSEGSWSAYRGYPAAFTFHEERAIYGGSVYQPQTLWLSESGDWDNMEKGTKDADAFWRTLSSDKRNGIRWLSSLDALIVGTRGDGWRIRASSIDEELTPKVGGFNAKPQTSFGSAKIQPIQVGSVVLFVDFVGRKLREMTFSDMKQKYVAPDLSALAEHITLTGITCIAHQKNPDDIIWCVLTDGSLLSMTYEREQDVVAWAKHVIAGSFGTGSAVVESVSVIPGDDEDEVWVSVKRTVNSLTTRSIEQLQPRVDVDLEDAWFVDSGLNYDGGDAVVITDITSADPAVITVSSWPVDGDGNDAVDGNQIYIAGVEGMTELNGNVYTMANCDSDALTFTIQIFEQVSSSPSASPS